MTQVELIILHHRLTNAIRYFLLVPRARSDSIAACSAGTLAAMKEGCGSWTCPLSQDCENHWHGDAGGASHTETLVLLLPDPASLLKVEELDRCVKAGAPEDIYLALLDACSEKG